MNTPNLITTYTAKGWTFRVISYPVSWRKGSDIEIAYEYQSPRLNTSGLIRDGFDEETLLTTESEAYVRQTHGAAIFASISPVSVGVIRQLAALYRLRDRGKQVDIPTSITVKDVVVRTS